MTDTRTPAQRRKIMQSVRSKNTGPELVVRKALFARGYRFRLHRRDLPGTPDIVFPGKKKVVFVHGCFWHGHECSRGRRPKSRVDFWDTKLEANRQRDRRNREALERHGWRTFTVWQCETKDMDGLIQRLTAFLEDGAKSIDK